jgi:hypothetical protein
MRRNAFIAVIGIVVLGGIVYNLDTTTEYVRETITETVEVTPDWASDTEAVEAAQEVIRKKALTESINVLEGEIEALTATYETKLIEMNTERERLEEQLSF